MKLFLDTSVLLAASASAHGASRTVLQLAPAHGWSLIVTPYVIDEVLNNLGDLPAAATAAWVRIRQALIVLDDVVTVNRRPRLTSHRRRTLTRGDRGILVGIRGSPGLHLMALAAARSAASAADGSGSALCS